MWRVVMGLGFALLMAVPVNAAAPTQRDGFIKSCETQMLMTSPQCACMADKAEADLDERSILYLSLGATDVKNTAATAKAMTGAELAAVDKFMKTAPGLCKGAK
ncbi:hypothetical protein [Devosia sp.]|uniref:hypothetical protein n=1 Tax=Devosia sp. TaxID=1871048 RepID=UPI003BA9CC77